MKILIKLFATMVFLKPQFVKYVIFPLFFRRNKAVIKLIFSPRFEVKTQSFRMLFVLNLIAKSVLRDAFTSNIFAIWVPFHWHSLWRRARQGQGQHDLILPHCLESVGIPAIIADKQMCVQSLSVSLLLENIGSSIIYGQLDWLVIHFWDWFWLYLILSKMTKIISPSFCWEKMNQLHNKAAKRL